MTSSAFVAGAALISALVAPFTEGVPPMPTPVHSADVSDTFLSTLLADCSPGGLDCRAEDLVACWLHESGLSPRAQNPEALAAGFFQAMPSTLRGLGFRGAGGYQEPVGAYAAAERALEQAHGEHPAGGSEVADAEAQLRRLDKALSDAFRGLSLEDQLVWAYRYYRPHRGRLVNAGACYAANFVPGLLPHAAEEAFVICAEDGRASWPLKPAASSEWYRENHTLDANLDGAITMGDLAAVAASSLRSARAGELVARIATLRATTPAPTEAARITIPAPAPDVDVDVELVADAVEPTGP